MCRDHFRIDGYRLCVNSAVWQARLWNWVSYFTIQSVQTQGKNLRGLHDILNSLNYVMSLWQEKKHLHMNTTKIMVLVKLLFCMKTCRFRSTKGESKSIVTWWSLHRYECGHSDGRPFCLHDSCCFICIKAVCCPTSISHSNEGWLLNHHFFILMS